MNHSKTVLGGKKSRRVCLAQISPAFMDREASVARAVSAIGEAAKGGAELIVFPEAWLAGYPYWTEGWDSRLAQWIDGRVRFFDQAVIVPSAATAAIAKAARDAEIVVIMGCNEADPRPGVNTIYNSLLFFDQSGRLLGRHRKLMPTFSERLFWGAGDGSDLSVYETSIGRIGALICGEHLMTSVRAAMIAMGEDFHVAVFPGAFGLHTGPRLEEWNGNGDFWGHFVCRAHAFESGSFVLSASAIVNPHDVPDDFPYKEKMNIDYAKGGSQIISPLGVPLVGPVEGEQLIFADCEAWMIKAVKAIIDTAGHYGRADVVRVLLSRHGGWVPAGAEYRSGPIPTLSGSELARSSDQWEIEQHVVAEVVDQACIPIKREPVA
ncbi:MAG TPA: carbon-nitrogen hydrolase family protein [Steroidobacteraceae bacterium]|nr:carbon-nitrogen hydrolase family protein [Steroidobacteraceae bacterium]